MGEGSGVKEASILERSLLCLIIRWSAAPEGHHATLGRFKEWSSRRERKLSSMGTDVPPQGHEVRVAKLRWLFVNKNILGSHI